MSKVTLIKIQDTGRDYYTLDPSELVLGRRYDNGADLIEINIPSGESGHTCVMIVTDINGKVIDHIRFDSNTKPIRNNISQYESVKIGFYFMGANGYIKGSEIKTFTFLKAQKPSGFVPVDPEQNENVDYLIQYGFTNSELIENTLVFYNMNGDVVKEFDFSPFTQEQSDLAESDNTKETFVKNKSTKYLTNEGSDGTDTYAEMGDVTSAVEGLKDDLEDGTVEVAVAKNVSTKINGKNITDIFESDGTTAKSATKATQDGNGDTITDTYVPKTRTVNGKGLSADVLLSSSDVGALSNSTKYGASLGVSGISVQLKDQDGNNLGSAISVQDSSKADKTDAVGSIELTLNSTTYVMTLQAKNINGQNVGTAQIIDLPLESIVSSATYYDSYTYEGTTYTKVIVLVLSTTSVPTIVPVGALVSGLQSEITSQNKLSADLIADGTTNKVYTATEQTKLSGIESGAQVNTLTGVKGNAENSYRTGNVEIDPDDLDDTNTTNKFVSSTEKSTWNGKQDAISSSNKLSADLVDDSSATNKFVTAGDKTTWSGKQDAIDSSHKLSADLVDDTSATNKFTNTTEKSTWNGKQDALVSGTNIKTINSGSILGSGNIAVVTDVELNGSSIVTNGVAEISTETVDTLSIDATPTQDSTNLVESGGVYSALSGKEDSSNKVTSISNASTDTQYPSAKCVYDYIQSAITTTLNTPV